MAELNRAKVGLLGNYNSLTDEHLSGYFKNPRMRRHLVRAGLIRQNGQLVAPSDYKTRILEEQRWLASQAFLAQAIVQKALDMEYSHRAQLRRQLEELIRLELVERVRSARKKNQPAQLSPSPSNQSYATEGFSPSPGRMNSASSDAKELREDDGNGALYEDDEDSNSDSGSVDIDSHFRASNSSAVSNLRLRPWGSAVTRQSDAESSPYLLPMIPGSRRGWRTHSAPYNTKRKSQLNKKRIMLSQLRRSLTPGPRNVQYSSCDVTLRFLGTRSYVSKAVNGGRQEVVVKQQFSNGNPVIVFCQPLTRGSAFSFTSRRYFGFPFSITIHVDTVLALQLSACCEYKYSIGGRLGGHKGYFTLLSLSGSRPCTKCDGQKLQENSSFFPTMTSQSLFNTTTTTTTTYSKVPSPPAGPKPNWSSSKPIAARDKQTPFEKGSFSELKQGSPVEVSLISPALTTVDNNNKNNSERNWQMTSATSPASTAATMSTTSSKNHRQSEEESEAIAEELGEDEDDYESEEEEVEEALDNVQNVHRTRLERVEEEASDEVEESLDEKGSISGTEDSEGSSTESGDDTDGIVSGSDQESVLDAVKHKEQDDRRHHHRRPATSAVTTDGNPEITVTKPESGSGSFENRSEQDDEEGSEGESYSESSSSGEDDEEEDGYGTLLSPDDAARLPASASSSKKSHQITTTSTTTNGGENDDSNIIPNDKKFIEVNGNDVKISSKPDFSADSVPFDSSDDDDDKEVKTVTADVHVIPSNENHDDVIVDSNSATTIALPPTDNDNDSNGVEAVHDPKQSARSSDESSGVGGGNEDTRKHRGRNLMKSSNQNSLQSQNTSMEDGNVSMADSITSSILVDMIGKSGEIELTNEELTEDQIHELSDVISNRPELTVLTIRKGGIDDFNIIPLVDALIDSNCALKSLNLNLNKLGPQAGQQIAKVVKAKPTLEGLFLHGNLLHDTGLCAVMHALMENNCPNQANALEGVDGRLQRLDVGDCNFRNDGATSLASLVEQCPSLTTLVLTGNSQLTNEDWCSIFWAVGQNPSVTTLLLDYCGLGDIGAISLVAEIKDHPSLQTVDLEGNDITDEGGHVLFSWIKKNPPLIDVRLDSENNIKESIITEVKRLTETRKLAMITTSS